MEFSSPVDHFASPLHRAELEQLKHRSASVFETHTFWYEFRKILALGLPIGFSISTRIGQYLTDQAVVGHLGSNSEYLAAVGLAEVWMTICGTFLYAFAGAISVLSSQAFGASNYKLVSQWYHVGGLILFFLTLPAIAAWMYTEPVLSAFGTDKHIAHLAGVFAKWSTISLIPNTQFMAMRMYFKSQSIVMPSTVICAIFLVFNLLFNLMFVYGYIISNIGNWLNIQSLANFEGFGYVGSPMATATTRILQFTTYVVYMFLIKKYHKKTWSNFTNTQNYCLVTYNCHDRVSKFLKIAIPQMISSTLEDWQIQIITLFVSHLNNADVAAFVSLITMILFVHCAVIGVNNAISVRIGNALGAGNWKNAKYTAKVGLIIGALFGTLVGVIFVCFAEQLAKLVSNDPKVIDIYKQVTPIIAGTLIFLALFTVQVGILLGQVSYFFFCIQISLHKCKRLVVLFGMYPFFFCVCVCAM